MGFSTFGGDRDPASQVKVVALQAQNGVAAGTGDNTEVTSAAVDRKPQGLAGYDAGVIAVNWKTSLTASQTLALTLKIEESDDNSSWGSPETLISAETQSTGAQTNLVGQRELNIDLRKRKRYVRFKVTMDLSAGATDTFVYGACIVLTDSDRLPV